MFGRKAAQDLCASADSLTSDPIDANWVGLVVKGDQYFKVQMDAYDPEDQGDIKELSEAQFDAEVAKMHQ